MLKIKRMSNLLANKIAAGEVIEKTVNVVKELVENSIDAEANKIVINLKDSGLEEIEIIDNGSGMSKGDLEISIERHATSKIIEEEDLFNIRTLGFRGEALASISAVAKLYIQSCDGRESNYINIAGGELISSGSASMRQGTHIIVRELFYNTPVRYKYLKNNYNELATTVSYVEKLCLAHPDIQFILSNNGKTLLTSSGNGNLSQTISDIYGYNIYSKMIYAEDENIDYKVSAYFGKPELQKRNQTSIITLVNNRIIRNYDINKTISEYYHHYMPKEKYPYVILKIEVDPYLIDVNIHPTKYDIKFSKLATLTLLIEEMLDESFKKHSLIAMPDFNQALYTEETETFIEENYNNIQLNFDEIYFDSKADEGIELIKEYRYIGIYRKTYIMVESLGNLFLIDQHAAEEKVNYEKVLDSLKNGSKTSYQLLIPIEIELSSTELVSLSTNKDILNIFKYQLINNKLIIKEIPNFIKESKQSESIRDIVLSLLSKEFDQKQYFSDSAAMIACKMSIKAGYHIDENYACELINALMKCNNPYNCPHGRPTIIKFTNYEIERMFKRIMN